LLLIAFSVALSITIFVQLQEEEAYVQRQKLLEDMLSLKERESEFELNQQMKAK